MTEYKNPGSTATLIVPDFDKILLVKRKYEPYKGKLALPGGFLEYKKESLEKAAARELKEETGLIVRLEDLKLLMVNSEPDRDPRDHVIDHVYLVRNYTGILKAGDDAEKYEWFYVCDLPELAFDHMKVIKYALAQDFFNRDYKM